MNLINIDFASIENRVINMDRLDFEKTHTDNLNTLKGVARENYKTDMYLAMYKLEQFEHQPL